MGGEAGRHISGRVKQLWLHLLSGQCCPDGEDSSHGSNSSVSATPRSAAAAGAVAAGAAPVHTSSAGVGTRCCWGHACCSSRKLLTHLLACEVGGLGQNRTHDARFTS